MFADLTLLQKLWNKGTDITAGVITSTISAGIVAVIATIFWNWEKRRDLRFEADKQRQQHRGDRGSQAQGDNAADPPATRP
jgi:hypothetical protein